MAFENAEIIEVSGTKTGLEAGQKIAADLVNGALVQRIKIVNGADGSDTPLNPLTDTELRASAVPVSLEGAATETTLSALNTKTPALGQALEAASVPVVLPAAQVATLATENTLAALNTKTPALGQALAAASVPVVLTAAQLTTLTPPAAISGFATDTKLDDLKTLTGAANETAPANDTAASGLNGRLQRLAQNITALIAKFTTGAGTATSALRVTQASDSPDVAALGATSSPAVVGDVDGTVIAHLRGLNLKAPASQATQPLDTDAGMPVRAIGAELWRVSFAKVAASGTDAPDLSLRQTGSGMAVSQSAGNLVVTTGTTANAETLIRSTRTFRDAHTFRAQCILSQRIANNNFEFALADLIGESLAFTMNSATSVTVTFPANPFTSANVGQSCNLSCISGIATAPPMRAAIASVSGSTVTFTVAGWTSTGSGTLTVWGWNYHRVLYTGTTATAANYDAQRNGWNSGDTVATINTTLTGHIAQLQCSGQRAVFSDELVASSLTSSLAQRADRKANIPDDDTPLYLFVRAYNGTANPATTTTWTVGFVSVKLGGRLEVTVAAGEQGGVGTAVPINGPVTVTSGTVTLSANTPTLAAGTNLAGDTGVQYRASATGAASLALVLATASTNATTVKASAGRMLGFVLTNTTASAKFVKFYNKGSAPTVGTDIPIATIGVPPNGTLTFALEGGMAFSLGVSYAITGASPTNDTTAVSAGDVTGTIAWV